MSTTVTGYREGADAVEVLTDRGSVRARYVIAADGGNSSTRAYAGVELTDYGFAEPWMVCDFAWKGEPRDVPKAMQVCDPVQPGAIMALGDHYQRFSFMLSSQEAFALENDPQLVWQRVSLYLAPDDADLIRVATYTFRSLLAANWRRGRVLLAGDAVHQMPPFLGQGMCAGMRDAQNLAFKLDLILRGEAGDALLDSYEPERRPHVEAVTLKGVEVGRIQTMRDPAAAAERDRRLLADRAANRDPEKLRLPGLTTGFLQSADTPARGSLFPQGHVRVGDAEGLFDDVVGTGFVLLVTDAGLLTDSVYARAGALVQTIGVLRNGSSLDATAVASEIADLDAVYLPWFTANDAAAVLVRPDCYVYGTAADAQSLDALLDEITTALRTTLP